MEELQRVRRSVARPIPRPRRQSNNARTLGFPTLRSPPRRTVPNPSSPTAKAAAHGADEEARYRQVREPGTRARGPTSRPSTLEVAPSPVGTPASRLTHPAPPPSRRPAHDRTITTTTTTTRPVPHPRRTTPARASPRTRGARPTDGSTPRRRAPSSETSSSRPRRPSRTRGTRTEESRTNEGTPPTTPSRWPRRRRAAETSSSSSTSPTRAGTTTRRRLMPEERRT